MAASPAGDAAGSAAAFAVDLDQLTQESLSARLGYAEECMAGMDSFQREDLLDSYLIPWASEDDLEANLGGYARILAATLNHSDKGTATRVDRLVSTLFAHSEKFFGSFAKFVQVTAKKTKASSGAATKLSNLVRWCCLIIQTNAEAADTLRLSDDVFTIVLDTLLKLTESLWSLSSKRKAISNAHTAIVTMCDAVPSAYPTLLEYLSKAEQSMSICPLLSAVAEAAAVTGSLERDTDALLDMFINIVFSGRGTLTPAHVIGFPQLIGRMDHDAFANRVLPIVDRATKRSAENALIALATTLPHVSIDLSQYAVEGVIPPILPFLKGDDDGRQMLSVKVIRALAGHISDPEVVKEVIAAFDADFKKGLTYPYQRIGVTRGISALSASAPALGRAFEEIAASALDTLLAVFTKESNANAKVAIVEAMGEIFPHVAEVPKDVIEALTSGGALGEMKGSLRRATLIALARVRGDGVQSLDYLGKPLCDVALQALDKINMQVDGVLALTILASGAPINITLDQALSGSGLYDTMWGAESYVRVPAPAFHVVTDNYSHLCDLYAVVAKENTLHLPPAEARADLAANIVTMLTHAEDSVRAEAHRLMAELRDTAPLLTADVTAALLPQLSTLAGVHPPRVLAKAVFVPSALERSSLVSLVTVAHHAAVVGGGETAALWASISESEAVRAAVLDPATPTELVASLLSQETLTQADRTAAAAAVAAAASLATLDWSSLAYYTAVAKRVNELLDDTELSEVREADWGIFHTPAGSLYEECLDNSRQKRSGRSGKTKEEEEWEAEVAARTKKLNKKEMAERQAKLDAEAAVRRTVDDLHTLARGGLSVIALMVKRAAAGSAHIDAIDLGSLLPAAYKLLKYHSLAEDVIDFVRGLATSVVPPLFKVGIEALAMAIVLIETRRDPLPVEIVGNVKLELHAERATYVLSQEGIWPLPPLTLVFCFPVIRYVLLSAFPPDSHATLTAMLAAHATQKGVPRGPVVELLYLVHSTMPFLESLSGRAVVDMAAASEAGDHGDLPAFAQGILYPGAHVRNTALEALRASNLLSDAAAMEGSETHRTLCRLLWVAKYDEDEENAAAATELYTSAGFDLNAYDYVEELIPLLGNEHDEVRRMVGRAYAGCMDDDSDTSRAVASIVNLYIEKVTIPKAKAPDYTRSIVVSSGPSEEELTERVYFRAGVAAALGAMAESLSDADATTVMGFFFEHGLADPLESIREVMIKSGIAIVDAFAADTSDELFELFNTTLEAPSTNERDDMIREGLIIFLGTLAGHLDPTDPKVLTTANRLIEALAIPSAAVQKAIASCLPRLSKALKPEAAQFVDTLLTRLLNGETYGERRGAAHGLAGLVKGLSLAALTQHDIMTRLEASVTEDNPEERREAVMFAYEAFSVTLGRMFEPYVVHIMGHILDRCGDQSPSVRAAAVDASQAIMGQLTGRGVKLVLPMLLEKLSAKAWRTKVAGVEILGTMAFCAPKQLSQLLPTVVPTLIEVLSDTHTKVQAAGKLSLSRIASVISNPEIMGHSEVIQKALHDPARETTNALEALLYTQFVHRIDAPSLALIVPIIHRGLRERSTETKKKATRIVGNMCSLTDTKDLEPYLDGLIPSIQEVLLDPIPEVRSVAAKALGSLVSGMPGDTHFQTLVPWLIETLKSDAGAVERSGAAQGLSEVLGGLGIEHFERLLPDILANTASSRSVVREGFLNFFVFMPPVLGKSFEPYIGDVLPCILQGLADEVEFVRDTAFKAGQVLVTHFGKSSLNLLLPALEDGLFDDNWRIRQSSVSLLGDLLYLISGISGNIQINTEDSDDEGIQSSDRTDNAIADVLGEAGRARVLSALYMMRCDLSAIVRQAALQVWKQIVAHTPRTLRSILSVLMDTLISSLASENPDRRQVAGRTLGDIVKKLGDRVLSDVLPILEAGLDSPDPNKRQGVVLGLSEVMSSAGKAMLETYVDALMPAVRRALSDDSDDVREAAAGAFDMLYATVGVQALNETLPPLLTALEDEATAPAALDALRQILAVRANVVLPYLLPQLTEEPMSAFNCRALGTLAEVAGPALNPHIGSILPKLVAATASGDEGVEAAALSAARRLVRSVMEDGMHAFMTVVNNSIKLTAEAHEQAAGSVLVAEVCAAGRVDLTNHIQTLLRLLLRLLSIPDEAVCASALEGLTALCGTIRQEDGVQHVPHLRSVLRHIVDDGVCPGEMPGFAQKKALTPLIPMLTYALLNGSPEMREASAIVLGQLVELTPSTSLKPYCLKLTGPLIRIVGDRFPWQVKAAILSTLSTIINKAGAGIKAFVSQLQTTLIKAIHDPTRQVRTLAISALAALIPFHNRIDQLVTELVNGIGAADVEPAVVQALLNALASVIDTAGSKITAKSEPLLYPLLSEVISHADVDVREAAARALAGYYAMTPDADLDEILFSDGGDSIPLQHGAVLTLGFVLPKATPTIIARMDAVIAAAVSHAQSDNVAVRTAVVAVVCELLLLDSDPTVANSLAELVPLLARLMSDASNNVRRAALPAVKRLAKRQPDLTNAYLDELVPPLMAAVKDRNMPVKLAAERALLYVLQLQNKDDSVLEEHVKRVGGAEAKAVADYARRVLMKLDVSQDSDDEGDNNDGAAGPATPAS